MDSDLKTAESTAFKNWIGDVDSIISAKYGLGIDDLPDMDLISMFEDGTKPSAAAKKLLKNAGE